TMALKWCPRLLAVAMLFTVGCSGDADAVGGEEADAGYDATADSVADRGYPAESARNDSEGAVDGLDEARGESGHDSSGDGDAPTEADVPSEGGTPTEASALMDGGAENLRVSAAGLRWFGRVDITDPGKPRTSWSGTGFVARFSGTGLRVELANDSPLIF